MKEESSDAGMKGEELGPGSGVFRQWLWRVIFLSDTRLGRAFDVALLWSISLSVLVVVFESVESIRTGREELFRAVEWAFTLMFALEYLLRIWVVRSPVRYMRSFFGIVDLVAFLPAFVDLLLSGTHYLIILRVLRMLRVFRVLKMAQHIGEAGILMNALQASRAKISVFLFSVMTLVFVEGTMMYVLENRANPGFNNIPQSIYWAIVTLTTVGYGDISPVTVAGKVMASVIMLTGFAILAVPTGVVTAELGREMARHRQGHRHCRECGWNAHDPRARFCQQCGVQLTH